MLYTYVHMHVQYALPELCLSAPLCLFLLLIESMSALLCRFRHASDPAGPYGR